MKDSRCSALRMLAVLSASTLLVQCSMPPQQAWRYIQSNGLLTYLNSSGRQSPPFGTGVSRDTPRYVSSSSHRYNSPAPNWYANWSSGMPNRVIPRSSSYSTNRYYTPVLPQRAESSRPSSPSPRPRRSQAPSVKIPVEEPSPAPQITKNEPPATAPKNDAETPKTNVADLPYGTPVPGRVNMVNSPYAGKTQLVDVSGMGAGQTVKCPYTGKLFKVPSSAQAENKSETPKSSPETDSGDKKP